MRAFRISILLAITSVLVPVSARAVNLPPFTLSHVLRAAGSPTVPASWAGIWSTTDTTRDCNGPSVMVSHTALDTLCAGAAFGPDTTQYQCSGTFSDTDFDLICIGQMAITKTCSVSFNVHLQGTRSGNVVRTTTTLNTTYMPTLCAFLPDGCELTTGTSTLIGSAPPNCATTPVHARSWAQLKLLYR